MGRFEHLRAKKAPAAKRQSKSEAAATEDTTPIAERQGSTVTYQRGALGKRSDPNFHQTTTYLRNDIWESVRHQLIGEEYDYSDLVNILLTEWLERRKVK